MSASQNRFNVAGTRTLYFGENFVTAYAETVQQNANLLINTPVREHKTTLDSTASRVAGKPALAGADGLFNSSASRLKEKDCLNLGSSAAHRSLSKLYVSNSRSGIGHLL